MGHKSESNVTWDKMKEMLYLKVRAHSALFGLSSLSSDKRSSCSCGFSGKYLHPTWGEQGHVCLWNSLLALFTWGDLVQLSHKQQHRSLLLKPHIALWCFDIWAVCLLWQTALILSLGAFWLNALQTTGKLSSSVGKGRVGSNGVILYFVMFSPCD